jgi:hypothetical protein
MIAVSGPGSHIAMKCWNANVIMPGRRSGALAGGCTQRVKQQQWWPPGRGPAARI